MPEFDRVSYFVYQCWMTSKEMKRWLASQGATFKEGKGSHLKVYLHGRQTILPMHGKDLKKGLEQAIRKDLGLA